MPPNLLAGQRSSAVRAAQIALRKALAPNALNKRNGHYGSNTIKDVVEFRRRHGITPFDGRVIGERVWDALRPFMGPTAKRLLVADAARRKRELAVLAANRVGLIRERIREEAIWGIEHNANLHYTQFRPMAPSLRDPLAARRTDCSSYATLCYKAAGAPDPNGFNYNGYGYTGTLWNRGTPVSLEDAKVGDLVLYGTQAGGVPSHVAIYIGNGQVATFGSEPGPRILPVRYRSDLRGIRRYDLT